MTGILFTEQAIFPIYNMASTFPGWAYNAEIRLKAVLQTEFCRNAQFAIGGIVFGSSPMQIPAIRMTWCRTIFFWMAAIRISIF